MASRNLQNNKGPVQPHFSKSGAGFVILFAVTVSGILLSIALGISSIALKEIKFGTSARDTNDAFFAADTGAEYALFHYKSPSDYPPDTITEVDPPIVGLGSTGQGCAKVTVDKATVPSTTIITSRGYNDGGALCVQGLNSVERKLIITIN
ncbi:MAG: hypothetical protein AAB933_00325 [Patescibacteria group bacterium]